MGTSIWIKAIRGYLHFLCGFWLFLTCSKHRKQHPQEQGPIEVQIDQKDSEEGQPAGHHSCQMLLSDPGDGHPCRGWWLDRVGPTAIDGARKGRPLGLILLSPGMSEGVSQCHRALATAHF